MTLDQKIQIWVAVGRWLAGVGSLAAAVVALYLSRRGERVCRRIQVGLRLIETTDSERLEGQDFFFALPLDQRWRRGLLLSLWLVGCGA
jgi:hypothetical protein